MDSKRRPKQPRRPKSFSTRYKELVEELDMLSSDLRNFEQTDGDRWLRSVATRLRKLLVERPNNKPLLIDLAKDMHFPLAIYVSNVVIADLRAEKAGKPRPLASVIPNILSSEYDPWYATAMPLDQAIELRCFVMGGEDFTFKEIILDIANTEGAHSDLARPEALHTLDKIDFSGVSGAYMAVYHLGLIVHVLGRKIIQISGR